jgi:hypothetical protein
MQPRANLALLEVTLRSNQLYAKVVFLESSHCLGLLFVLIARQAHSAPRPLQPHVICVEVDNISLELELQLAILVLGEHSRQAQAKLFVMNAKEEPPFQKDQFLKICVLFVMKDIMEALLTNLARNVQNRAIYIVPRTVLIPSLILDIGELTWWPFWSVLQLLLVHSLELEMSPHVQISTQDHDVEVVTLKRIGLVWSARTVLQSGPEHSQFWDFAFYFFLFWQDFFALKELFRLMQNLPSNPCKLWRCFPAFHQSGLHIFEVYWTLSLWLWVSHRLFSVIQKLTVCIEFESWISLSWMLSSDRLLGKTLFENGSSSHYFRGFAHHCNVTVYRF